MSSLEEIKKKLNIESMDEATRKEMFNKFIEGGGEVIKEKHGPKIMQFNRDKQIEFNEKINTNKIELEQNNMGVLNVKNDFNHILLIEDLNRVFGFNKEMYLEIDLEDYQDVTSLNNLIGSSKGYVGYEQGGLLTEHIIKYPITLIFFKNFNKAHYTIQNYIKGIFNKNYIIDNKNRKIYLNNVLFLTTNLYEINKISGFLNTQLKNNLIHLDSKDQENNYKQFEKFLDHYKITLDNNNNRNLNDLYNNAINKILKLE
jgi:hypothetical protein